ncbi:MAG: hypothetical protein RIR26_2157 [Pseudomonadota bacterium]
MKFYGSVVTSCFLLLSAFGCKPKPESTVSGIAGEKPKKGNCSDVNDWIASPVTCQKDKNQVVVTKVFEHKGTGHDWYSTVILNWAERAKRAGIHTCFGEIKHFSGGQWRDGAGVWLNGQGGLGGCHPGTGYRNVTSGAKGTNVVTPIIQDDFSVRDFRYKFDLVLPTMKSKKIGMYNSNGCDMDDPCLGRITAEVDLCTGEFEKVCDIAVSEGTLKIEVNGNAKAPCIERGTSYPHGAIIEGRKCVDGKWR